MAYLPRDHLTDLVIESGTGDCVVTSGTLDDPCTATIIDFVRGDGDAATWLPPNKAFRRAYVARQVGVKEKYGLWLTPPELASVERVFVGLPQPGRRIRLRRAAGRRPRHLRSRPAVLRAVAVLGWSA